MKTLKLIAFVAMALVAVNVYSQAVTLDEAIKTTATELGQRLSTKLPSGTFSPDQPLEQTAAEIRQQLSAKNRIAVLNFSSGWLKLSDYVIDELLIAIDRNGSLTVVDRQQLDLARKEQNFQIGGEVDDKSQQSIGKFLGAQSVLSGSLTEIGSTYRFRIRVISVETGAVQYSNSIDIKKDTILTALMKESKPKSTPVVKAKEPKPPKEPKTKYDYNFFDKLGIGLLNIPFGLGTLAFDSSDKRNWRVGWTIAFEVTGTILGVMQGATVGANRGDSVDDAILVGGLIGLGIGSLYGIGCGFLAEYSGNGWSQAFPVDINIVSVSSNNVGVQVVYKMSY